MSGGGDEPYQRESAKKVSDEDILAVFDDAADSFLSTSEVESALPVGRRAVLYRLNELHEAGQLETKSIGNASTWWLPAESVSEAGIAWSLIRTKFRHGSILDRVIMGCVVLMCVIQLLLLLSITSVGLDWLVGVGLLDNPGLVFLFSFLFLLLVAIVFVVAGAAKLVVIGYRRKTASG